MSLLIALGFLLLITTCGKTGSRGTAQETPRSPQSREIVRIQSSLNLKGAPAFKVSATNVGGREDLSAVFFLDETRGWIGGGDKLYKTVNGGVTWTPVKLDVPQGAHIDRILFVNPVLGWILLQKTSPFLVNYKENHFWLRRSLDGGQSWQSLYDEGEAKVTDFSISENQTGWLTGIKYVGLSPARYTYLILHTTDDGQHWTDVSDQPKRISANQRGTSADEINDAVMGLIPTDTLTAIAITGDMTIFKTANGGKDWQLIGVSSDSLDPTSIRRFGLKEGKYLWVAGGTVSTEGTGATLSVEQLNNSWAKYTLVGGYFADALFLSDNQFLASGFIKDSLDTKRIRDGRREGAVFYSRDGGKSWETVFRNKQVGSINALAAVDPNHIWAVGDSGLVLRLDSVGEKKSATAGN